jgi:Fur family ferric uptake transcriptional regulator
MSGAPHADRLRAAGLRATGPRLAVLRVLVESHDHPRVDQVIERVRRDGHAISVQAAYDVCEVLHRTGLARRIELPGGPARYEARAGDNHHHLVCRRCNAAVDVDCATGDAPCLAPAATHGYALEEAEITFRGLCPDCRTTTDHERGAP